MSNLAIDLNPDASNLPEGHTLIEASARDGSGRKTICTVNTSDTIEARQAFKGTMPHWEITRATPITNHDTTSERGSTPDTK